RRQPRLLFARQSLWTVVMRHFHETGGRDHAPPALKGVVGAEALTVPYLFIAPARVRAEEDAPGFECLMQRAQHAWQFLRWNVKQRRIGEDAVEMLDGQVQLKEILVPHFTA